VGSAIAAAVGYIGGGVWITIYFGLFTSFDSDFVKNAGLITLCGVIMSMLVLMSGKLQVSVVAVVCICILSAAVYFIAVMALRVFSREELKSLPMSKLLLYIDLKLNGGNNERGTYRIFIVSERLYSARRRFVP
jgi:FtsH-binding integral membrane protein